MYQKIHWKSSIYQKKKAWKLITNTSDDKTNIYEVKGLKNILAQLEAEKVEKHWFRSPSEYVPALRTK